MIALAGNKCDLEQSRAVSTSEVDGYASEAGLIFFETSAKTNVNITEIFEEIARKLPQEVVQAPPTRKDVDLSRNQAPNQGGCSC